jgi:hypothetical protein
VSFIRKFKTASGATGVQVCRKEHGEVVETIHIGSATDEKSLEKLVKKAREVIHKNEVSLFDLSDFEK